jgi:hypothetical protein
VIDESRLARLWRGVQRTASYRSVQVVAQEPGVGGLA